MGNRKRENIHYRVIKETENGFGDCNWEVLAEFRSDELEKAKDFARDAESNCADDQDVLLEEAWEEQMMNFTKYFGLYIDYTV